MFLELFSRDRLSQLESEFVEGFHQLAELEILFQLLNKLFIFGLTHILRCLKWEAFHRYPD
jgi:hypothetical protein